MAETKGDDAKQAAGGTPPRKTSRLKRWLIVFAVIVVLCGGGLLVAEHRTSQPEFCASCHVMVPYYDSWAEDPHGGKLNVACVECHYAPGERTTIKAKFRGLSQVASYFSGRYGATRPRAHVSNLSCLTSRCHGDEAFMDKPLQLGTVTFLHSKHLKHEDGDEQANRERLAKLQADLKAKLGAAHFDELQAVAREVRPGNERQSRLLALCKSWMATIERETLIEFTTLEHRGVRLEQLHSLQCVSCHSYNSPAKGGVNNRSLQHFQVNTTTCYTCHFQNEGFNTGTNTCLNCHSPPQKEITVHAQSKGKAAEALGIKPVKMNHTQVLAQKVDCVACHADTVRDESPVSRRDCEHCHDQPRFFEDFKEPFTLELVAKYHSIHVEQQRAKCLDCHTEIKHQLLPTSGTKNEPTFLSSTLSDCKHCHPNHHAAQIELLSGRGGITVPESTPNLMFGSRTNCSGCHTEIGQDPHGGSVTKATDKACFACHDDRHKATFERWKQGLALSFEEAETALAKTKKALEGAADAKPEARAKASKLLQEAQSDFDLVKRANGLHNITYAMELLEAAARRAGEAEDALGGK